MFVNFSSLRFGIAKVGERWGGKVARLTASLALALLVPVARGSCHTAIWRFLRVSHGRDFLGGASCRSWWVIRLSARADTTSGTFSTSADSPLPTFTTPCRLHRARNIKMRLSIAVAINISRAISSDTEPRGPEKATVVCREWASGETDGRLAAVSRRAWLYPAAASPASGRHLHIGAGTIPAPCLLVRPRSWRSGIEPTAQRRNHLCLVHAQ